jgi:hypothetical protein
MHWGNETKRLFTLEDSSNSRLLLEDQAGMGVGPFSESGGPGTAVFHGELRTVRIEKHLYPRLMNAWRRPCSRMISPSPGLRLIRRECCARGRERQGRRCETPKRTIFDRAVLG